MSAGYCIHNKQTGQVELLSLSGPLVETGTNYVSYYHDRDPQRALIEAAPSKTWVRLSERLPAPALQRDEWYNDFLLKAGLDDALGVRLFESRSHTVLFGINHAIDQAPFAASDLARVYKLFAPLAKTARLHAELRGINWGFSVALQALEQLAAGVIVAGADGSVAEMNRAAERILRRNDGLLVRNHRLAAFLAADSEKLTACIAAAAAARKSEAAIGRLLVARRSHLRPYAVTVAPLRAELGPAERPMAMIVVTDPDERSLSANDLADFFGLSPGESRVALALLAGKRLGEIAVESGVQISTLRTQLSSILKKMRVERQADMIRALTSLPVIPR